jgi:hypothetical protein
MVGSRGVTRAGQGALQGFITLLWAEEQAVGHDELKVCYANEAQNSSQVGLEMLQRGNGRAGTVKATMRNRDDDPLPASQSFRPGGPIAERSAGDNEIIDALSWLGTVKLYISAPITTVSAARNCSSTAWPAATS